MIKTLTSPKSRLTALPDTLYNIVVKSSGAMALEIAPAETREPIFAPLIWGLALPPAVTVFGVVVLLESNLLFGRLPDLRDQMPIFLVIPAWVLVCTTSFLCCLPMQIFGARVMEFRCCLIISTFVTLFLLVAAVSSVAEVLHGSYGLDMAAFLLFVLLAFCITPLGLALRKMEKRTAQVLTLVGFLAAVVVVQFSILKSGRDYEDERAWMLNSVLVGLAFAIWLCTWGAKEFRRI